MNDIDPRVMPDSPPDVSEDIKTEPQQEVEAAAPVEEVQEPAAEEPAKPPKGYVPFEAVAEERKRRKELELQLEELKAAQPTTSDVDVPESDEGRLLKQEIRKLEQRIESMHEQRELDALYNQHPALKDKEEEFSEFRKEYPRHKLQNVAKLFLVENDLVEAIPTRKGLEKPTGGSKAPAPSTPIADVKRIRETQPRKYIQMLREGKINPADIK